MTPTAAAKRATSTETRVADAAPVGIGVPVVPVPVGLVVEGVPVAGVVPVVPLGNEAVTLVGRVVWVTETVPELEWVTSGGETPWQRTL